MKALAASTGDPMTLGHLDYVKAGLRAGFSSIVYAIAESKEKKPLLPLELRKQIAEITFAELGSRVTVVTYEGLTVDLAVEHNCDVLLRGMRTTDDFGYEQKMRLQNMRLARIRHNRELETVLIFADEGHSYVSSTFVRQLALCGATAEQLYAEMHPEAAHLFIDYLRNKQ